MMRKIVVWGIVAFTLLACQDEVVVPSAPVSDSVQERPVVEKAMQPMLLKEAPSDVAVKEKLEAVVNQEKPVVIVEKAPASVVPEAAVAEKVAEVVEKMGEVRGRSVADSELKAQLLLPTLEEEVVPEVTVGDALKGKKVAKKCMGCHTFDQGGKHKSGPNLFAIVGRERGAVAGFNYGTYLAQVGGIWDEQSLRAWVDDSKAVAKAAGKRSKMGAQRISSDKANDLMAYLKSLQGKDL